MKPTPPPGQTVRKRSVARTIGLAAAWLFGVPFALAVVLYVALLIHPIPLPFISTQVRNVVVSSMPAGTELELGDMALALEGYAWPVIQFSPVVYRDTASGAKVKMDALEVGFSPVRALIGQPGATVTIVGPHIQLNQDLFGPRLAEFEVVPDAGGGPATVKILEGSSAFPDAAFKSGGIDVNGETTETTHMRSDNDWLVFNLEAAQKGIASVIEQADMGRFSRLIIKRATVDMNDAIYGSLRTFTDISLDIAPTPDGRAVEGNFSADFGGTVMQGIFERMIDKAGDARLMISLNNFDLSAFAPLINDTASMGGIVGPAAVSLDLAFEPVSGKIKTGVFHMDMTGTDLRIDSDYFPIASNIIEIDWAPDTGTFNMAESTISVGGTTMKMSGVFVMGLDDLYGPTVAMSMSGREIATRDAAGQPLKIFDTVSFKGWSAPLYGAMGIDQVVLAKDEGARLEARGRVDMLRKGIGVDMAVAAKSFTAADLKAMWPPLAVPEARDWFLKNVLAGEIESANMKLAFPVGTLSLGGEPKPIPQNGVFVEMVASGLRIQAVDGMAPIDLQGKTRLQMHDDEVTIAADGGLIRTGKGDISVANAALMMTAETPGENIVEISGDLSGGIPAIAAIAQQFQPDAVASDSLPVDLNALAGNLSVRMVSTILLDSAGATKSMDYSINGNVQDFGSTAPLQNHVIGNGQLSFMATQAGYRIGGTAQIDGMDANVVIEGDLNAGSQPAMTLSSVVELADLAKMGFDASEFGSGKVGFTAKLGNDGAIDMNVDLKSAALTIKDLGITKEAGQAGSLKAIIRQTGDVSDISNIDLAFGDVRLKGSLEFDAKKGLQSAEFSNFALSDGDAAQLSMTPIKDGYAVRIRGDQLDLKPLLTRFFDLNQGSGGPQATSFTQTIALDVELKRALGMYKTNAFNLNLDLALKGSDLRNASMQAQIGNGGQLSIATNPTDDGRTMTVVFNDLGSVLRFVGIYPQLQGGEGSFVLAQNTSTKIDSGTVNLKNFAIVDEQNVANILNEHPDSRRLMRGSNTLVFDSAKASFIRRKDRIQIVDAVVTGDTMGGSGEGFIYTDSKQYDLVGTFIPIFGINNAFGKLFGGGNNGGMFGITFAVRGPLDKPDFKINPLSALAPGAFRSLFEYRAKEQPRID